MSAAVLEVQHLVKRFGGITAVNDCSFTVQRGAIVGLIGPNGAGKTTVFNIITGFMRPDAGCVRFEGTDITKRRPDQIFRLGISRTFQSIRLFPKMAVLENVILAIKDQNELLTHALLQLPAWKREEEHNVARAHGILEKVGLKDKGEEFAGTISYGQQKLLEIGRALGSEPELLLLDEPAAGVNPTMLQQIRKLLLALREEGKTILLVEHDMEFVMGVCDSLVVLDYGKEIAIGPPAKVQRDPRVLDAYLGGV